MFGEIHWFVRMRLLVPAGSGSHNVAAGQRERVAIARRAGGLWDNAQHLPGLQLRPGLRSCEMSETLKSQGLEAF